MIHDQIKAELKRRLNEIESINEAGRFIGKKGIPTGVSNRHVHLSQGDVEALFGYGYQLTPIKDLKQPGQFAANECVTIVGPKGSIERVRVLGPTRDQTQLEISKADCYALGIKAPVRESGDLHKSADALLVGPSGFTNLQSKVICAQRHIHMTEGDANSFGVTNGQKVKVKAGDACGVVFDNVVIRVNENYALEFHIDTDEANAAAIRNGENVYLIN
ncbi:phosphate propanoyltransferase [Photobacterium leiognathi]|uniref:phosphate propanoyltransferase n=1 Tax=Photobacterium leiognathi TaxID=553611 RepID=UPI001EDEA97C|nr:phosphate propanoyltransferase [Photobacterium leiognathi]MCG3884844.1 phosphate propanoyltransferase [Photobacterium leiognathi]